MTARMRRLLSDYEQVKKDFAGHKNIIVTPMGTEPPEKYHITYFVKGIFLQPDGSVTALHRHEVEITLHADYPRYKPLCKILTPIWHPNFRDGQICIGDIWGAGESLTDIIINIGDMIQYKSWNSFSPLSADAAKWAIENKHLFPVGDVNLYLADYASAAKDVEIDLEGEEPEEMPAEVFTPAPEPEDENDFEITAEELEGVTYVPSAQRMQTLSQTAGKGKLNFKTVLMKGLLWALIGTILSFFFSEWSESNNSEKFAANLMGYSYLAQYYEYDAASDVAFEELYDMFEDYCEANGVEANVDNMAMWLFTVADESATALYQEFVRLSDLSDTALDNSYNYEFFRNQDALERAAKSVVRLSTGFWASIIAVFIGLALGIGEGVFYGSGSKAVIYGLIGAGISLVLGIFSGYLAQLMYSEMLTDEASDFAASFIRGLGWSVMGLGVGLSAGLIKPNGKRILFCALGGLAGGFTGGFLFNYVTEIVPNDTVARGVGILIMGLLIGLGVGLLEQMAKQAWLKVIRGEFEGKEYLVFDGTTSIGNNGSNTIVLFKDKLVGPHHCDIKREGNSYVIYDCGTPMGTIVNGAPADRRVLRHGDAIALGNSVLIFNTK